jgi:hypothetical protein
MKETTNQRTMGMITAPHTGNTDVGKITSADSKSNEAEWWRYVDTVVDPNKCPMAVVNFSTHPRLFILDDDDRPDMTFLEALRGPPGPSWEGFVRIRRVDVDDVGCCLGGGCLLSGCLGSGQSLHSSKTRFLLIKGHFGWVFEDNREEPTGDMLDFNEATIEAGIHYGKKLVLDIRSPSHTRYFLSFGTLDQAEACRVLIESIIARLKNHHGATLPSL